MVINRAKFDGRTNKSFGGVKTDTLRIALYGVDKSDNKVYLSLIVHIVLHPDCVALLRLLHEFTSIIVV